MGSTCVDDGMCRGFIFSSQGINHTNSKRDGGKSFWSAVTRHRLFVWRLVAKLRRDKSRHEKAPTSRRNSNPELTRDLRPSRRVEDLLDFRRREGAVEE